MLIGVDKKEGRARCTFIDIWGEEGIVEAKGRQGGRKRYLLIEVDKRKGGLNVDRDR